MYIFLKISVLSAWVTIFMFVHDMLPGWIVLFKGMRMSIFFENRYQNRINLLKRRAQSAAFRTVRYPKVSHFLKEKRWKSGTLWEHLPKRLHF